MLDIEIAVPPVHTGLDIITVAELKQRLHITSDHHDSALSDAILEAADKIHGIDGELNRTVFPTTYKRYLSRFPDKLDSRGVVCQVGRGIIPLPYPKLVRVVEIAIEDGSSPTDAVDSSLYVVRTGTIVGEIELKADSDWPDIDAGPRAVSITYEAGYVDGYPPKIKKYVAMLAAHYFRNNSATILEPRQIQINRKVEFGIADLRRALTVPHDYSDWGEN